MSDIPVVILAGGRGSRLAEETEVKPKPMVEIGGRPILWHIMKHYAHYNFKEFYVALGYKGDIIKRYFVEYYNSANSITLHLGDGKINIHNRPTEDWLVHLMETGLDTNTGGRILRLRPYLEGGTFMVTYGDGVSNININDLLAFHRSHGKMVTLTAVRPSARFGGLVFNGDAITQFTEKPQTGEGWINGGFLVAEPEIFDYLKDDKSSLERSGLDKLASDGQLMAYRHDDFWQCMDTLRDVQLLEGLWSSGSPAWRVWTE